MSGLNHKARPCPAGLATDFLFFQSNLGVVVGARIKLRIRQQAEDAIVIQGPLDSVILTLKHAYEQQLITNPPRVAEPGRAIAWAMASFGPFGSAVRLRRK